MKPPALRLLSLALLAATLGCQASQPVLRSPGLMPGASVSAGGRVELSVRWPYRTQVIPTSTQRLVIRVEGPTSQRTVVDRPVGEAPVSVATLELEAGDDYRIAVEAYDASDPDLPIASGRSEPFSALPNTLHRVTVALQATFVPAVLSVSPDNGGPGALVTVAGSNFGLSRGLWPVVSFGGILAARGVQAGPEALTVRVPAGARSGPLGVTVDGVPEAAATASFRVLSILEIVPTSTSVTAGAAFAFTARGTTEAGMLLAAPNVEWSLMPMPDPAYVDPGLEDVPAGSPYLPAIGSLDSVGRFVSNGATGSQWLQIVSGSLTATAAITVRP